MQHHTYLVISFMYGGRTDLMRKIGVSCFVLLLAAVLFVHPAYAIGPAQLTVKDLTTNTVLSGYGSYSNPYPLTVGHRYRFTYGQGYYYEYLKLWVGGSFSNVQVTITQLGSGGCTIFTSPIRVDCDSVPSEQGDIYKTIQIDATLSQSIDIDAGFYRSDQHDYVHGDHNADIFYET